MSFAKFYFYFSTSNKFSEDIQIIRMADGLSF